MRISDKRRLQVGDWVRSEVEGPAYLITDVDEATGKLTVARRDYMGVIELNEINPEPLFRTCAPTKEPRHG